MEWHVFIDLFKDSRLIIIQIMMIIITLYTFYSLYKIIKDWKNNAEITVRYKLIPIGVTCVILFTLDTIVTDLISKDASPLIVNIPFFLPLLLWSSICTLISSPNDFWIRDVKE